MQDAATRVSCCRRGGWQRYDEDCAISGELPMLVSHWSDDHGYQRFLYLWQWRFLMLPSTRGCCGALLGLQSGENPQAATAWEQISPSDPLGTMSIRQSDLDTSLFRFTRAVTRATHRVWHRLDVQSRPKPAKPLLQIEIRSLPCSRQCMRAWHQTHDCARNNTDQRCDGERLLGWIRSDPLCTAGIHLSSW